MSESTGDDAGLWARADLVTPMALRVAATLRIADLIAGGRDTSVGLAGAAGADIGALERLLRHLVAAGVLLREPSGRYSLSPAGQALRDDHPSGLRDRLDMEGAVGRADLAFVHLLSAVRSGAAAFAVQFGRPFWEDLASDPVRRESFDAQMGTDVAAWAPQIVAAFDWGSLGRVVDVGGGDATLLVALLRAYPHLRGTVVDQAPTAGRARETLEAAGLSGRGDAVAGSFFDPLPPGAGGYLLSAVLHDWDDEAALAILGRCADAAGDTGGAFVIEKTGADATSPHSDMDLRMLVYFGGAERSLDALAPLAAGAGLAVRAVHPAGDLSVVELRRG
ncbi:MAG: methyltransferase [Acidimicrobiales bacterium]